MSIKQPEMKFRKIIIAAFLICPPTTFANTKPFELGLSIDYATFLDNCAGAQVCQDIIASIDAQVQDMKASIENQVNSVLPKGGLGEMSRNMGNAAVMASKGHAVDYTSNDIFVLGASAGLGLGLGSNSISDLVGGKLNYNNLPGFGVQVSGMAGFNLGAIKKLPELKLGKVTIDPKRFTIFINYMGLQIPSSINANLKGAFNTWGFHVQYQLMDPRFVWKADPKSSIWSRLFKPGLLNWSGLKITSGLDYTDMRFQFLNLQNIRQSRSLGGVTTVDLKFDGAVGTGVDVRIVSIPMEISTGYQLGWIFEHYAGVGIDLAYGKADLIAAGGGFVSGSAPGLATIDGVAKLSLGDPGRPSFIGARVFTGVQLKLFGAVKTFVHGNFGFIDNVYGLNLGARVGW
jgi:hypothetical protein